MKPSSSLCKLTLQINHSFALKSDCENANISGYHWWVKGDIKSGAEIGLLGHP